MDPLTRLVFLGLISMADDAGRLLDSVRQIDALLFAYTEDSSREALANLSRTGRITRGLTASGQQIIQIANWHHQKVDHPNLKAALPPIAQPLTKDSRGIREPLARRSRGIRDSISTNDLRPATNGRRPKRPPASGDAVPRTTGLDVLPKADCDELFELWTARRGVYAYSRFRKNMLLLFQSELTRYTTPEISDAIIAYAEWVEEQPDKEQGFCTLDRFITEIAKWVRFGKMPLVESGEMTERGQWAGSRELREESLAKRSA